MEPIDVARAAANLNITEQAVRYALWVGCTTEEEIREFLWLDQMYEERP